MVEHSISDVLLKWKMMMWGCTLDIPGKHHPMKPPASSVSRERRAPHCNLDHCRHHPEASSVSSQGSTGIFFTFPYLSYTFFLSIYPSGWKTRGAAEAMEEMNPLTKMSIFFPLATAPFAITCWGCPDVHCRAGNFGISETTWPWTSTALFPAFFMLPWHQIFLSYPEVTMTCLAVTNQPSWTSG